MDNEMIQHFTDLIAWKKGHELVLQIYSLSARFPNEEKYGLTSQIRRAVSSFTSNIAEGFGRYFYKERIKFYYYARGSVSEVENHLIIAKDLKYINQRVYNSYLKQIQVCNRVLNGLVNSTKELSRNKC